MRCSLSTCSNAMPGCACKQHALPSRSATAISQHNFGCFMACLTVYMCNIGRASHVPLLCCVSDCHVMHACQSCSALAVAGHRLDYHCRLNCTWLSQITSSRLRSLLPASIELSFLVQHMCLKLQCLGAGVCCTPTVAGIWLLGSVFRSIVVLG